jgi:hypothetical protein
MQKQCSDQIVLGLFYKTHLFESHSSWEKNKKIIHRKRKKRGAQAIALLLFGTIRRAASSRWWNP